MSETLLRTKLHPSFTRSKLVDRPRLKKQIAHGLQTLLTLVIAPAGYGKTTLAASSITDSEITAVWLSLDANDNQPERFLRYLAAALQEAAYTVGHTAAQLLAEANDPPLDAIMATIINDLDAAAEEIVLVLDDYQFIINQVVHDLVAFLLEQSPQGFHLLLTTRSDPPLLITRMRARGQVVELRAADLRFTRSEVAQFLNDIMGLRLDERSIAALEARTEGWIAGLQMAAVSMRHRQDVSGFIAGFTGTNRFILDYLMEEVLAIQPPQIRHFLLYTSILRLFFWLPPFRVLMVWVYDNTESLLLSVLMHASLVASLTLFVAVDLSGMSLMIWILAWSAALWIAAAAVILSKSRLRRRKFGQQRAA